MSPARKTESPETRPVRLDQVLKSLGDPVRLSIVRQLLATAEGEKACGCFQYDVNKATFAHHIAVLEAAGIVQGRPDGTRRLLSLRIEFLRKHYPGLVELIRSSS